MRYEFDGAVVDTDSYTLSVDGEPVAVEPQVFEVLAYLIAHRDRMVSRTELLDQIWGDRFVSDSALSSRIKTARAAIGDDGRSQRAIRTVHGRGFRFVAPVVAHLPSSAPATDGASASTPPQQTVRFVESADGARLAVAEVGAGPPLVKAANWLTHVELDWGSPVWRHWNAAFGSAFRYVRYDARGCGLSDRDIDGADLTDVDLWVADLEAVVDAAGLDTFVLLGISQGAVPAMEYARRHPGRVSHLVLHGAYALGMRRRGPESARRADTLITMMRDGWGGTNPAFRSVFTMTFLPESSSEQMRWYNELQLASASVEGAVRLESAFHDVDLSAVAAAVEVPTIVFHCERDLATPYEQGRRLAGLIPGAEFVTLDSANHVMIEEEPSWAAFLDRLGAFVGVDLTGPAGYAVG